MNLEFITSYFKEIEHFIALPPWAILAIVAVCLILIYFYAIHIPIAIIKNKKELTKLRHMLGFSIEQREKNLINRKPRYLWNK